MLNEDLVISGLDIGDAMARLRNNTKLYTRLISRFLNGDEFDALKNAMESGDCQSAVVAAHTLKGAAANLSAVGIQDLVTVLEQDLKTSESLSDGHFRVLSEIENKYAEIRRDCAPYLEG